MKNKLWLIVVSLVCVVCCACALAACNEVDPPPSHIDTPPPSQHTHTFEDAYNGKDSTGHWKVALCEHKDAKGDFEPHKDVDEDGYCDVCGYEWGGSHGVPLESIELIPSEYGIEVGEEGYDLPIVRFFPEYATIGEIHWETDNRNVAYVQNGKIYGVESGEVRLTVTCDGINATCIVYVERRHTHTTSLVEGRTATCTQAGRKDYYTCSGCSLLFLDAAATQQVEMRDLEIPAGHKYGNDNICTVCGQRKPTEGLLYAPWSRSSSDYAVAGIGSATDTDIVIASEFNGRPVVAIEQEAFADCASITSVYVPDSIWSIGRNAFSGCTSLAEVTGAENVDELYGGIETFENTALLNNFYNDASIDGLYFGTKMFASQQKTHVTVKEGTTHLFPSAFDNNRVVTDVHLPDSLVELSAYAFRECPSLTNINIPNGITSLGDYMFQELQNLQSVTLPESLETFGVAVFESCSSLSEIDIPEGVTVISDRLFNSCTSLARVSIPKGVTAIGSTAFSGCWALNSITIPDGVETIDQCAFWGAALESITIPSKVTSIGFKTFAECKSLNSVNLANVESIGQEAFVDCTVLTGITFAKVQSIGEQAFKGCTALTELTVPDTVQSIGKGAFEGCSNLQKLVVPFIGGRPDSQFDRENVANSDTHFGYIFGATFSKHGIADATPNNSAFVPESLKEVTITQVSNIASYAFYNCTHLEKIVIKGESDAGDLNNHVFEGCSSLKTLIIPRGVTSLNALPYSLTTLVLPYTVSVVSNSYDNSGLTVFYEGTAQSWAGSYLDNSYPTNATHYVSGEWHYDEDGMPVVNA